MGGPVHKKGLLDEQILDGWLLNGRIGGSDQTMQRGRKLIFELCTGFSIKGSILLNYNKGNSYLPRLKRTAVYKEAELMLFLFSIDCRLQVHSSIGSFN